MPFLIVLRQFGSELRQFLIVLGPGLAWPGSAKVVLRLFDSFWGPRPLVGQDLLGPRGKLVSEARKSGKKNAKKSSSWELLRKSPDSQ